MCVYGCVNDDTEEKTHKGKIETIIHKDVELKLFTGKKLLDLILGEHTDIIINHVKDLIDKMT